MQLIASQLMDGHWVLSFSDADAAHSAQVLVQRCASDLRARFAEAMEPLLRSIAAHDL